MHKGQGVCILVHEVADMAPSTGGTKRYPHTRRLLRQNRHNHVSLFACNPRAIGVNPLLLAQADVVYIFELPNEDDRETIAGQIGWSVRDLSEAIEGLGRHEYLRFDANELKPEHEDDEDIRLRWFRPLPAAEAAKVRKLG